MRECIQAPCAHAAVEPVGMYDDYPRSSMKLRILAVSGGAEGI
jgi:hypothetical protein